MSRPVATAAAFAVLVAADAFASPARAQPPKHAREAHAETPARARTDARVAPPTAAAEAEAPLVVAVPGGMTADQVAARAASTSWSARASEELASAAEARTAQAWTAYVPRVDFIGSYTRLSDFVAPSLTGGASVVVTPRPAGTPNPTPTIAAGVSFPNVLDDYLVRATIVVPVSDYFLRIGEALSAASRSEEAARWDVAAAKANAASDARIAYFTWLRSRGAVSVAEQAVAVAKAHEKDAENQFQSGNASKADVLRAETQVASAELGVARAKNAAALGERQVRVAIHARDGESIEPGEGLDATPAPVAGSLRTLVAEANAQRAELKSIDKSAESLHDLAAAQRALRLPQLSAVGDATYANPNPRVFPQTNEWFATWSVGARITWSPNDFLLGGPAGEEHDARARALEAQKNAIGDAIELEVAQAYQGVLEADSAIGTSTREVDAAVEGYRVARDLFNAGRGTATSLVDAENALTRARFDQLDAKVDARIARVRLDHAVGRSGSARP